MNITLSKFHQSNDKDLYVSYITKYMLCVMVRKSAINLVTCLENGALHRPSSHTSGIMKAVHSFQSPALL